MSAMCGGEYYQLHSFPNSQAAAGAVEKATIEPMVPKPPNSNAVQMIRVFMAVLPDVRYENPMGRNGPGMCCPSQVVRFHINSPGSDRVQFDPEGWFRRR